MASGKLQIKEKMLRILFKIKRIPQEFYRNLPFATFNLPFSKTEVDLYGKCY